ncbi:MAG: peptidyl-prolyl cis-trans isomerase SurA [Puniceicoccaceae bacterium 5H]|nr:MAG: peptidyl-prolyl cis-trans isomerase SurA [Puniceicoccaceae bacterium 5H]
MAFIYWRLAILGAFLTAPILLTAQKAHNIWDPPYKQGIAAEVEGEIITFEDLRREMGPLIPRIRESARNRQEFNQKMENLYFEVLQNLIDRVLIVDEFGEKEFNLPQSYIENEYDRILAEDFGGDRAEFLEYLKEQGQNVREFRRDLRDKIIVSAMRSEKRKSESQVSPERIEAFYNENKVAFYQEESVKLRIIMLRPLADENADLMQQSVEKVLSELDDGKDFSDVARKYSQDSRRESGGDWGWLKRTDLKDELAKVAFDLKPGEHSDPVKIANQTFILYVEDYRPEGILPLAEVRDRIEEILAGQLARQAQEAWLDRLRRDAYVRYY